MDTRALGEIGYVAFVIALVAVAFSGGQALLETKPAIAEGRSVTLIRPAKVSAVQEIGKKELSPIFPVLLDKRISTEAWPANKTGVPKARIPNVVRREKTVGPTRKPASSLKPVMTTSYAAELPPGQTTSSVSWRLTVR